MNFYLAFVILITLIYPKLVYFLTKLNNLSLSLLSISSRADPFKIKRFGFFIFYRINHPGLTYNFKYTWSELLFGL